MDASEVRHVLDRLQEAVVGARNAWPDIHWRGNGADSVVLREGMFPPLRLEPGTRLEMAAALDVPERLQGVRLVGEPLEMSVNTLYPVEIAWQGRAVADGTHDRVAPGPALIQVLPQLRAGDNGELRMAVLVPDQQPVPWLQVRLMTPGLRRRHEALDVAWARLALADAVAAGPEDRELVARAASTVPVELTPMDGRELEEALAPLAGALAPLAPRVRALRVHVIGHSHIDMNWLWTWPDTLEVIKRDLRTLVALMDDYAELTFTHSQAATYEAFRQEDQKTFARIQELVASGRWEVAAMQWVESDLNVPSGEALARQLLEGVGYARDNLGVSPSTFLAPDTFGHTGNLPQLAVSAGARRYYHMRTNPGQDDPWPAYWWEGLDGSRLLVTSTESYNGEISAGQIAAAAILAHRKGQSCALYFHGIGDHGGGPTRHGLDALRRFRSLDGLPDAGCSTLGAYTDQLLAGGPALPVHRGELGFVFEGCYTTHGDAKRNNRQGESALVTADTLAALAGLDCTEELREAWRLVLFNQFHDILCGSSIHEAYARNDEDLRRALAIAGDVTGQALELLGSGVPSGSLAVTNPLGWAREEPVVVEGVAQGGDAAPSPVWLAAADGSLTPGQWTEGGLLFVARARPFAIEPYEVRRGGLPAPGPAFTETERTIEVETPFFSARVHRESGSITSLWDRRVGRQLVGGRSAPQGDPDLGAREDLALGTLQLLDEHHHGMAAWRLDNVFRETSLVRGGTTSVVERGPVRVVLATAHHVRRTSIVQRVIFYQSLARIDYETWIDWGEPVCNTCDLADLKVAFTAHLEEVEAWFETAFGAVRRVAGGREVPALRWADVGGDEYGVALLNDCKHGYDALGPRLRLTLVHGSDGPDPLADIGQHRVRYSLVPHPGSWRDALVPQQALGFNQPLLARVATDRGARPARQAWTPAPEGSASVLLSGIKRAATGEGIVLRVYESAGRTGEVSLPLPDDARAWEVSIVEDRLHELSPTGGALRLAFRPWQVRSVVVEEAPRV